METWLTLLFWLLVAHALADYPLQGDFLAKAKDHTAGVPGVPWIQALGAHALIHGGMVAAFTGSIVLGLAEMACHAVIDYGKSAGWLTPTLLGDGPARYTAAMQRAYHLDQLAHAICKVAWVLTCAGTT